MKTDYREEFSKSRFHLTSLLREFALGRIHSFVPPQWGHPLLARLTGSRPIKRKTYPYYKAAFVIKNSRDTEQGLQKQIWPFRVRYEKEGSQNLLL
jgi:hypothetical protein